jgi:TPR repeat protein
MTGQAVIRACTPSNNFAAASWFRLAAGQGNPAAQYMLGAMYFSGEDLCRRQEAALPIGGN